MSECCSGGSCEPTANRSVDPLGRRTFLAASGLALADLGLTAPPAAARTVAVPAEKNIGPARRAALTARGAPTEYTGDALRPIGMPVGGVTCGQVYLGGDGSLWLWDVYNTAHPTSSGFEGTAYTDPVEPFSPFRQDVRLDVDGTEHPLDAGGFTDVRCTPRYPIGQVSYVDKKLPVSVRLEAFSPYSPGEFDVSALPATMLVYTVRNTSRRRVSCVLRADTANPVCLETRQRQPVTLTAGRLAGRGYVGVEFGAEDSPPEQHPRDDILFEDWENGYDGWTVTGTAFGAGPVRIAEMPDYMKRDGGFDGAGDFLATSHDFRSGGDVVAADAATGSLRSAAFTIERQYLSVRVGGGDHAGQTCVNLVVDGSIVASMTGVNAETLHTETVDVRRWEGQRAHIEIVDDRQGDWGHITCDTITFTDRPEVVPVDTAPDGGSFAVAVLDSDAEVVPEDGTVAVPLTLRPGQSATVRLVYAWYFPNPLPSWFAMLTDAGNLRHHYANRFASAAEVVAHVAGNAAELEAVTRDWVRAFYEESTLPHWFLERTLANASTLATNTCYRFADGRFYAWEGMYCCPGTCEHVWNYAQSVAYLFAELERDARERVDLGIALHTDTGAIDYRAEYDRRVAADGQAGTLLRVYREHRMSADSGFLQRVWPRVKLVTEYLIGTDAAPSGVADGLLTEEQYNTLDQSWYGKIPWISGLYVAALRAAEAMAGEVGDTAFAGRCAGLAESGSRMLARTLFDPDYGYFVQELDPEHQQATNSNRGCYIDQMYGQTYAAALGLPRVFDAKQARSALRAIFRNNFVPDPIAWRDGVAIEGGRIFAAGQEPGTLMCTWPHGGDAEAPGTGAPSAVGYFNEVWTGTEYQFAAHLFDDGLTEEALLVTRAIQDRYAGGKRNPYNEIECSDHYARAMMSHQVFLAACGFDYHGPRGHLGFAPKVRPERFAAAFTAAEGWGAYTQRQTRRGQRSRVTVRRGRLRLRSLSFAVPRAVGTVRVRVNGHVLRGVGVGNREGRVHLSLPTDVVLTAGQRVAVELEWAGR